MAGYEIPPLADRLAQYLHEQAGWRYQKADEYPEDRRNVRSAKALAALAEYVASAPSNHPALLALGATQSDTPDRRGRRPGRPAWAGPPFGLDVFVPSEEGGQLIAKFGFHRGEQDFDGFLEQLVVAEARAAEARSSSP